MKKLTITHLKTATSGATYIVGTVAEGAFYAYGRVMTTSNDTFEVGKVVDVPEKMISYF